MRTHHISASDEEGMEHENYPAHTLASYAQQVSFPNWNTMVGDLGRKFARRSSFEKEIIPAAVDVEDVTDFLPKKGKSPEKNDYLPREPAQNTENILINSTTNDELSVEDNYKDRLVRERITSDEDISPNRKPIVRYCEIIKEDSLEFDEQPIEEKEEKSPSKIHISTVSIVLKSGKGKNRPIIKEDRKPTDENLTEKGIGDMNEKKVIGTFPGGGEAFLDKEKSEIRNEQVDDMMDDRQANKDKLKMINSKVKSQEEERYEMNSGKGSSLESHGDVLGSIHKMHEWRSQRTFAMDNDHLTPDYTTSVTESLHMKHRNRFRKKSSSFSGVLPLNFQTDKEEVDTPPPTDANKRKMLQRRRGTVDMGRIEPQKSPTMAKENRHRNDKVDPSHYLMHGGKRRGSFNPTYNQINTMMHKNRKNNTARAKSLFICGTNERVALRERLMKHACPELRESIELDDEKIKKQHENEAVQKDTNKDKIVTNAQRRPLRKSISFDSKPEVLENAQEIAEFYERLKNCDNFIAQHRITNRKAAIIPTSPTTRSNESLTTIITANESETKILTNNVGLFGGRGFSKPKGRQMRAQSRFAGVPSMYMGQLRQKNAEHLQITRSQSDSISSASSSEGGDGVDPFPMHTAAKNGKQKRLKKLLSKGMDVNARDADGWPPIHYALSCEDFETVALLLKAGANITDYTKGRTSKYFK